MPSKQRSAVDDQRGHDRKSVTMTEAANCGFRFFLIKCKAYLTFYKLCVILRVCKASFTLLEVDCIEKQN